MTTVIVIQARTGSTRLPSKVLLPCAGAPLLARMLERVCAARTAEHVVVATTTATADDPIVDIAVAAGVGLVRGHATDLLDRHVMAARMSRADVVVKIPSDCPLIDPAVIDRVIDAFAGDYTSNLHPATWPDGNDVEVMTRDALERAWRDATRPIDREHTTPYLWSNPDLFEIHNVEWERDYSKRVRLTIDYREDYELIRRVFEELGARCSVADILALLAARPDIAALNARYVGTSWFRTFQEAYA
ncbi:MAG TPA: glycosyltransferase family protein [Kofleriaceae bacterium]